MKIILRIILSYAVVSSIAAHLLALGIVIARPVWVEKALHSMLPDSWRGPARTAQAASLDLARAVPPWQPATANTLAPGEIRVSGQPATDLQTAVKNLRDGDTLTIGPGVYRQGLFIRANRVTLEGRGHVVFEGAAVGGKGTLVLQGNDTTIRNIECHRVQVHDRNGACVRLEGQNLILDHVYFHDSEQGLLTGNHPGQVTITDSRFSSLGKDGHAHGIYVNGGDLTIRDSQFLSSVSEGHEIKSRARSTLIERSVVASIGGQDSRLLDISEGGSLIIRQSVLQEGPASVNGDVIGFGLEKRRHPTSHIELINNIVVLDGSRPTRLLHRGKDTPEPIARGNLIVGATDPRLGGVNLWLKDRKEAGLAPYPALPPLPQ